MIRIALLGLLLFTFPPSRCSAGLIVTVSDLSLTAGESGFVDVFIRSDTGTDVLDSYGGEFLISGSGSSQLAFVDPPTDPHLTESGYLFTVASAIAPFPDSVNVFLGAPAGSVSSTGESYIGGDGTLSGFGVLVPTTDTLLIRLEVASASPLPANTVETYSLSLNELSFSTFFLPPIPIDPLLPLPDPINVTSNSGVIRVSGVAGSSPVVPEPGSGLIWLTVLIATIAFPTHRRRRQPLATTADW